jgi:hypothetical protein
VTIFQHLDVDALDVAYVAYMQRREMLGYPPASHQAYVALFFYLINSFQFLRFTHLFSFFIPHLSLSAISQREKAKNYSYSDSNIFYCPPSLLPEKLPFLPESLHFCRRKKKSLHFSTGLPLVLVGLSLTFPPEKVSIFAGKALPRWKSLTHRKTPLSVGAHFFH